MKRASLASLLFLTAFGVASVASAQPARDPAGAEVLFRSGVKLLEKGDWERACPEFIASFKLDPSVGTQINIARCAEHDGKLALAWAELKKAEVLNRETTGDKRKKEVEAYLTQAIAELEPRLPWLTLTVRPATSDLRILRNEVEIAIEGLGRAVPVDPGKHTLIAKAPGFAEARAEVELREGERKDLTLTLTPLEETPKESAPLTAPQLVSTNKPPVAREPIPPSTKSSPLVPAGVALLSVGGGALLASAITGGVASAARGTLDDLADEGCTDGGDTFSCSDPAQASEARSAIDTAGPLSVVSTVTLFGGIAAAGVGAVLLGVGLSDESSSSVAILPYATPEGAGVTLGGAF